MNLILTIVGTFLVVYLATPLTRRVATRFGILDRPRRRHIHEVATPRLGGAAIFLAIFGLLVMVFKVELAKASVPPVLYVLLLGSPLAFLMGLWDDIRGIRSRSKLFCQLGIAAVACGAGFRIESLFFGPGYQLSLGILSLPFTLLWVAGVMNAVNLVDGLDGLAGGISSIAFLAIGVLALISGNQVVAVVAFGSATATLAFLRYNFPPAQIFMGDGGSMLIGFLLAVLSMSISPLKIGAGSFFIPVLLLVVPFTDMLVAVLRRTIRASDSNIEMNRNGMRRCAKAIVMEILSADGDHIHHRLISRGRSVREVVLTFYSLAGVASLAAIGVYLLPTVLAWMLVAILVIVCHQLVLSLEYEEFSPPSLRKYRRELALEERLGAKNSVIQRVSGSTS